MTIIWDIVEEDEIELTTPESEDETEEDALTVVDESLSTSHLTNNAAVSLGLSRRNTGTVAREAQGVPTASGSGSATGRTTTRATKRAGGTQETIQACSRRKVAGNI